MKAAAIAIALAACSSGRADPPPVHRAPGPLAAATLCPTRGAVRGGAVDDAVFRAIAPGSDGEGAELAFTVRGPTAETVALASGQRRRQLGLKLRAADGCNLVYVMWRTEPKAALVVSIKQNPGAHTHADCGVRGYRDVTPSAAKAPPALVAGEPHTLRAAIDGDVLTAWIDDREVWRGPLDDGARALRGPAGVRSDNLAWDGELRAAAGGPAAPCHAEDAD